MFNVTKFKVTRWSVPLHIVYWRLLSLASYNLHVLSTYYGLLPYCFTCFSQLTPSACLHACHFMSRTVSLSSIKSLGWKTKGRGRIYPNIITQDEMSYPLTLTHADKSKNSLILAFAQVYLILSLYEAPELVIPAYKPSCELFIYPSCGWSCSKM